MSVFGALVNVGVNVKVAVWLTRLNCLIDKTPLAMRWQLILVTSVVEVSILMLTGDPTLGLH